MHDFGANVEAHAVQRTLTDSTKQTFGAGVDAKVRKDRRKEGRKPVLWRMDLVGYEYGERERRGYDHQKPVLFNGGEWREL